MSGYMLANRLLWTGVALALFGLTLVLFKPQRAGTGKRLFGKAKGSPHRPPPMPARPRAARARPAAHRTALRRRDRWVQCWHIFAFDAARRVRSVPFLVMLLFGVLNWSAPITDGHAFGTDVYPMTHLMLELLNGSFNFMLSSS
jgi:ABC-2 type transport system permease protein